MKTFIRASEVWVPSTDRTMLEWGGGLYRAAPRFAAISRTLCFGRGEGLPGQAWEQERPIVLKVVQGSYFRRTAAAHAEGITCGIAVPIYAGDFLTSVLVIFCGDDEAHAGAIELHQFSSVSAASTATMRSRASAATRSRAPLPASPIIASGSKASTRVVVSPSARTTTLHGRTAAIDGSTWMAS